MSLIYSEIKMFVVPGAVSHNNSSDDFQFNLSERKDFSQCNTVFAAFFFFFYGSPLKELGVESWYSSDSKPH